MEHQLEQRYERLLHAINQCLTHEHHHLELVEQKVLSFDPTLLLKRGYSITLYHGKVLRDPMQLKEGDEIETRVEKGSIKSKVIWKQ
jgi:Exonuclease VII, large subunit